MSSHSRDHSFDNIRFLLIFCVVFAHLLEVAAPFPGSEILYQVIYSFHMPAFLFLFGCFAKFSPKRILLRWCIPYLIFQSLYLAFARKILGSNAAWQYTTPYWLLWYLLACIFYQLLIPLYDTRSRLGQGLMLCGSVALALLVGFEKTIGYSLSLSRFFVFQPWFLLGFYFRKNAVPEKASGRKMLWLSGLSVLPVCLSVVLLTLQPLPKQLLYGSYSYSAIDCSPWMRLETMLIALAWILFLFVGIRPLLNRRIPWVTAIGQNTLPIFLLHGFLVRALPKYCPELLGSPWQVLLLSAGIVLLFGNRFCKKAVDRICFSWLENIGARDKKS